MDGTVSRHSYWYEDALSVSEGTLSTSSDYSIPVVARASSIPVVYTR